MQVPSITILHTKVYSGKTKGIPPMTSTYIPKNNLSSLIKVEFLWLKELMSQHIRRYILKIVFLGKDEIYFLKRHCKKFGMDWRKQIDLKHSLNRGIKNVENLVLLPQNLEFPSFIKPKHVRFFEKISFKNESDYYSEEYIKLKRRCLNEKNELIIYMAFGTLAQGSKVTNFFKMVISIIQELVNTTLIISKGKGSIDVVGAHNVFVFDYLPQLDVLSFTDLFITHGGLGSVKEAFHFKVPMLVVPMNKYIDQNGNAARIKANCLGVHLDIDNFSKGELVRKLAALSPEQKWKQSTETII
jgi:UDP:flavonoid glycosyltransferase YjiC (YdhE family)